MSLIDSMWFGLVLAVAIALFMLKYEVQGLEDDLAERQAEIEHHAKAIHVLKAEWTFLNDPERLKRLSKKYLDLGPVSPDRIVLPSVLPEPVTTEPLTEAETTAAIELPAGGTP